VGGLSSNATPPVHNCRHWWPYGRHHAYSISKAATLSETAPKGSHFAAAVTQISLPDLGPRSPPIYQCSARILSLLQVELSTNYLFEWSLQLLVLHLSLYRVLHPGQL
jgi:hypothetical protein